MTKNNLQGFTIVELMLTIAVFAIIMPSLIVGLNDLIVINNRTRDLALVNMLAQNKIELLRSSGFNSLPAGTVSFTNEMPSTLPAPKSASYTITNTVSSIKEITVTISYKDYNKVKTTNYKTIISELGVGQ